MFELKIAILLAIFNSFVAIPHCGTHDKECGLRAQCIGGDCECVGEFPVGDNPFFRCYKEGEVATEILNDPTVKFYFGDAVSLLLPCRFKFTIFQTKAYKNGALVGHCETSVFPYIAKDKGRFYLKGFDLETSISLVSETKSTTLRFESNTRNGNYNYSQLYPLQDLDLEYFEYVEKPLNLATNTVGAHFIFDHASEICGFKVDFTGFDTDLERNASYIPGLSVSIDNSYNVTYLDRNTVVGLAPIKTDDSYYKGINWPQGFGSNEEALFVRDLTPGVEQTQPNAPLECTEGRYIFGNCSEDDLPTAMSNCFWMLQAPRFIRCVDFTTNGNQVLFMFNECVHEWCGGDRSCETAINLIEDLKCDNVTDIPFLKAFLTGSMCPPS